MKLQLVLLVGFASFGVTQALGFWVPGVVKKALGYGGKPCILSEYEKTLQGIAKIRNAGRFLGGKKTKINQLLYQLRDYKETVNERLAYIEGLKVEYRHESLDELMNELYTLTKEAPVSLKNHQVVQEEFKDLESLKNNGHFCAKHSFVESDTGHRFHNVPLKHTESPINFLDPDGPYYTLNNVLFYEMLPIRYACIYYYGNSQCVGIPDTKDKETTMLPRLKEALGKLEYLRTIMEPWCHYVHAKAHPVPPPVVGRGDPPVVDSITPLFQRTEPLTTEMLLRLQDSLTILHRLITAISPIPKHLIPKPRRGWIARNIFRRK